MILRYTPILQKLYAFKSIQNNLKAGDFREKISLESHWRTSNLSGCLIRFYADGPKGRSEGIAIGRTEGGSNAILTILEQKGTVPDDLRERILSQKDEAVLKQWLLAAASAGDIENFHEKTRTM